MKNKNNIPENSLTNTPFLSKIKKENHFLIPKNYFEVLHKEIINKNLNNNKLQFLFNKLSYRILVPITSLIVIFLLIFHFNNNNNNTKTPLSNQQLSEIIINEDDVEIDDDLVYDAYAKILKEDETTISPTDKAYIDYLIDHDIDINSIIKTP